ncbi:MAG: hypothetical protein ACJ763_20015 [Bdellovibrionia bacterium]
MMGLVLAIFSLTTTAQAAALPKNFEVSLQTTTETSSEPLTIEKIASLDPAQPNPQLRRWIVSRKINIPDWAGRKLPGGLIGVQGGAISGNSTIYLKGPGPWYDTLAQFPCSEKAPDPVFATAEGSRAEAQAAAKLWDEMLSAGKFKLSLLLSKVAAVNERSARSKADRVFQEWVSRLDHEWRARVASEVIPHQWKQDRKHAEQAGYCSASAHAKKAKASSKPTSSETWMAQETPAAVATPTGLPLARAPSRRWQGWFAVRMDVGVSENSVLGQMLIDPATPRSILSPDWLKSQGMPPEWLQIPEAQPERVKIAAGAEAGETGLGAVTRVEKAIISDYPISVSRFLLFDTELFDEPEFVAPCCSGILGIDFLRRYVVEFRGSKPNEVNLWPLQSYHVPTGYQWVEVRENGKGDLVPVCSERVKALAGAEKLCRDPRQSLREASATIVFDLPHGRVWYSPEELAAPEYKNKSGLTLNYTYIKGDRALVVQSIKSGSVAQQLEKAGLKKGMIVTDIDGIPALEMDLWEVNRRLAGVYGDEVKLKWQSPKGFQVEPLRVLERSIRNP